MKSPARTSLYPSIAAIGDLDRLAALYSPFRSKNLNPEHYDEKQKFWIKSIEEYSTVDRRIVFSTKDLEKAFVVQDKVASCLSDVVEHLRKTGTLVCEDEYKMSLNSSTSWWSWSAKPLKFVASTVWNMSPFGYYTQKKITKDTRLVFVPQLLSQTSSILSNSSLQNRLMTLQDWREKVSKLINPNEIDLVFDFLKVSGNIITDKLGDTEIMKLVVPTQGREATITAAEKGQFDITRTKDNLEKDLQVIFKKQQDAENQARTALKEGQRTTAKYHLRTKKNLEKRSEKLCTLIDNLTVIAFQIEEAQTDARILAAYEAGKKALSKTLDDNNMSVDRATDVMLDMQEALEDQAEISVALSRGVSEDDIAGLEEELEQLLADQNKPSPTKVEDESLDVSATDETLRVLENLNLDGVEELNIAKANKRASQI